MAAVSAVLLACASAPPTPGATSAPGRRCEPKRTSAAKSCAPRLHALPHARGAVAHLRRKFFDAQSSAPDAAKRAMDFILDVYRIERAALETDLFGTPEHLEMRQTQSKAVMDDFKAWLLAEQGRYPPRGPMGDAISYALGNWGALTLFLTDPHQRVDNNASERALRVAALGRNYADLPIMLSSHSRVHRSRRAAASGSLHASA